VKGTYTGDLTLHTASGNSPALTFLRGTDIDTATDWRMYVNSGQFKLQNKITSTAWTDVMSFTSPDVAKNLNLSYNLLPSTTNTLDLGSSTLKWANVYATNFKGTADNATLFDNSSKASFFMYRGDFPSTFIDHTAADYKYENLNSGVYNNPVKDANGNPLHGELIVHFSNGGSSVSGL
jgi:hypothetical protein